MQGEEEHVTPIDISVQGRILNDTKNRTSGHVQNHSVMMTYTSNVQASSDEF